MKLPFISGRRGAIALAIATACAGAAVGAVIGSHDIANLAADTAPSNSSSAPPPWKGPGHRGGFGFGFGHEHQGAVGTVTAIDSSKHTLMLRTLFGSLSVTTSSSTTYEKERRSIAFGDIALGDVVAVAGVPTGGSSTTPPTSVAATRIDVREPAVGGRVQSVSGNVITVVTRDGELAYVSTTGRTAYYSADGSAAKTSAVSNGVFVMAEGTRQDLTHLTADVITVMPKLGGHPGFGPPGLRGAMPPAGAPFAFGDSSDELNA